MTNNEIHKEESSYRDNHGSVYIFNNKVLRTINTVAENNYFILKKNNIYTDSIKNNFLINFKEVAKNSYPDQLKNYNIILESEVLPFISYPYEWTFDQLKDAALHHLDFQIFLLNKNCVLRDSSAFNVQFHKGKPVFIDILSLKNYEEGEYWIGYKQFCENFLNPLLLSHLKSIHHNDFFRGSMEGLETIKLNNLLSLKNKFSFNTFVHVVLQSNLLKKDIENPHYTRDKKKNLKKFKKNSYFFLLKQLKSWIQKLEFKKEKSIWGSYSTTNTYNEKSLDEKETIIANFSKKYKPNKILDLGCNNGSFSRIALKNGAKEAVGVDFDYNAITEGYNSVKKDNINFLPLLVNLTDPSPNQGWNQKERKGFAERFKCNALIALALEHHLIIGKNIPIKDFIKWLVNLSEVGLLEFVPKDDQTIQDMLSTKEDIYKDYTEENFEKNLIEYVEILKKHKLHNSNRVIYEYKVL